MKATKTPGVISPCLTCSRPRFSRRAIPMTPKISISGELIAVAATERKFARNRRRAAPRKREISHFSLLKAFTMRLPVMASCRMFWISVVAGNGLVQDVLDLGKLVLSMPGSAADTGADLARGINDHGNEQQQHPRQVSAQNHNHGGYRQKSEKLQQKLGQHRGHGVLHPLYVVDD